MAARVSAAAASVIAALIASTAPVGATQERSLCGVERWAVKTLQDRPRLLPVQTVTLRFLVIRPAPAALPTTRLAFERHVYKVTAAVTLVGHEDDGDFHLALRAGLLHMIAEALAGLHREGDTRVAPTDAGRSGRRACPRTSEHHRRLVFRLQARPGRRRTERDRVAPDPRVQLPQPLTRTNDLAGSRRKGWPCKSNPVRLGSYVSRAIGVSRGIASSRPGF
jgi:hypothetical protein